MTTNRLDALVSRAAPRESAGIVVDDLAKTYPDGTQAVRGITLSVRPGETYGILGPNGAGKSTTMGMLGTLVRPTGGHALVAGFDVAKQPIEVRRRIGFAMQQAGVDEFATATELLVLQARLHGVTKTDATDRAALLLDLVGLGAERDKRLGTFSGGMKRRVDLAAALMHLPPILFLDEPTEGLDPRNRGVIWDTLEELRHRLGITIVLTTHFMDEADRLCDRIGIVDRGILVAEDTPDVLKAGVGREALVISFPSDVDGVAVDRAREAISGHRAVAGLLEAGSDLSVLVDDAAATAPEVLRILEAEAITPRALALTRPTLEDVYLRHTGRTFDHHNDIRRAA